MKPKDFSTLYRTDVEAKYKFPAVIEIPGQGSDNIKIRFKGSTTVFFPKRAYKIKFTNKTAFYNSPGSLRNIKLNPMFTDKSYIREKIIWDMFSDMGGFGPKECGYANLIINGEDRGVYLLIQDLDEEFLEVNNLNGSFYKSHEESNSAPGLSLRAVSELKKYFKKELAEIYRKRWQIELNLNSVKSVMGMDMLSCKTPEMVKKEIGIHFLAYNFISKLLNHSNEKVLFQRRDSTTGPLYP